MPGKPGEWTIEVTPKDTSHPMGTALLIQTDYPKEAPKSFYVNVQITNPMPPPMLRSPANQAGAQRLRLRRRRLIPSPPPHARSVNFRAAGEAFIIVALACLPAIGEGFYFRDKVSWQSAIPASELVTVEQARAWGDSAIWVDARPDDEFAARPCSGRIFVERRSLERISAAISCRIGRPDKKIVVYCSAQSCNAARDVAERLRDEAAT